MIGSLEMHEALDAHMVSISESVEAAGAGNATWAVPASLGVDDAGLMDVAGLWGELTERQGALRTVEAASAEGFISGFLVAVRVLQRCCCGNGEAEDDRSAVLRCPVHGERQRP